MQILSNRSFNEWRDRAITHIMSPFNNSHSDILCIDLMKKLCDMPDNQGAARFPSSRRQFYMVSSGPQTYTNLVIAWEI